MLIGFLMVGYSFVRQVDAERAPDFPNSSSPESFELEPSGRSFERVTEPRPEGMNHG